MEIKWGMVAMTVILIAMFSAIVVETHIKSTKQIEFAKAGLQECREDGHIVWKKECK